MTSEIGYIAILVAVLGSIIASLPVLRELSTLLGAKLRGKTYTPSDSRQKPLTEQANELSQSQYEKLLKDLNVYYRLNEDSYFNHLRKLLQPQHEATGLLKSQGASSRYLVFLRYLYEKELPTKQREELLRVWLNALGHRLQNSPEISLKQKEEFLQWLKERDTLLHLGKGNESSKLFNELMYSNKMDELKREQLLLEREREEVTRQLEVLKKRQRLCQQLQEELIQKANQKPAETISNLESHFTNGHSDQANENLGTKQN